MSPQHLDLDELAGLEEQRSFLLRSLDDLDREHEAGDLDDADYQTLRSDYTVRAAAVLRSISEHKELLEVPPPTHRGTRRFLAAVAVVIVAVVAGLVVASFSGGESSKSATGGMDLQPSKELDKCMTKMQQTFRPAAQGKVNSSIATDAIETIKCFTDRIESHPDDAVAFTYRGWTLTLLARQLSGLVPESDVAGFVQKSRSDFATALKLAPRYPDALTYSAINALWSGDTAGASAKLAEIDKLQLPANSPILIQINQMLRPALTAAQSSTTTPTSTPVIAPSTSAP